MATDFSRVGGEFLVATETKATKFGHYNEAFAFFESKRLAGVDVMLIAFRYCYGEGGFEYRVIDRVEEA